jgi:succinate dehydrogenase / fumarate reductase membrane anchor subunit
MKLKWDESGIKTPLARARGLGASRGHAVQHWIMQRVTAVANLFLVAWFVWVVMMFLHDVANGNAILTNGGDNLHPSSMPSMLLLAQKWLSSGLTPILMILLVASTTYHAMLGLQVVIEDYVHHELAKWAVLWGIKLALLFCAAVAVFSVLKVSL